MKKTIMTMAAATAVATGCFLTTACSGQKDSKSSETIAGQQTTEEEIMPLTPVADNTGTGEFNAAYFNNPENAKAEKNRVMTTPSGLKYVTVREGNGKQPAATDMVTVNYAGKLTDGTQFDSSYDRGEPTSFPLNGVIPGWTEGLQLMKEGGKTVFYIPSELGYGARGAGGSIPPNSDLIFVVELISVGQ